MPKILILRKCNECPFFKKYEDNGYGGRNTNDWCDNEQRDIILKGNKNFPEFCPLDDKE